MADARPAAGALAIAAAASASVAPIVVPTGMEEELQGLSMYILKEYNTQRQTWGPDDRRAIIEAS